MLVIVWGYAEPTPVAKIIIWYRHKKFSEAGSSGRYQCAFFYTFHGIFKHGACMVKKSAGTVGGCACSRGWEFTFSADSLDSQMLSSMLSCVWIPWAFSHCVCSRTYQKPPKVYWVSRTRGNSQYSWRCIGCTKSTEPFKTRKFVICSLHCFQQLPKRELFIIVVFQKLQML